MKTKFISKKPHTSIVHRDPHRKNVNLSPFRLPSFLGLTMGVLILMAMAAPSARAALETYYDFEDGNFTSDSPGLQPTSIVPLQGSFTFPAGTGTMVNAVTPETTNTALTLHPLGSAAIFTLGGLTTTGLTDVHLSFALLSAATGGSFTDLGLFYSINGGIPGTFVGFASVTNLTSHTDYNPALTFDVSALTLGAVDGVSGGNLFFAFIFSGATNGDAATFIDNIQVTAVPEPTTWIGGTLAIPFLGFVYIQRRRRAQMLRRA